MKVLTQQCLYVIITTNTELFLFLTWQYEEQFWGVPKEGSQISTQLNIFHFYVLKSSCPLSWIGSVSLTPTGPSHKWCYSWEDLFYIRIWFTSALLTECPCFSLTGNLKDGQCQSTSGTVIPSSPCQRSGRVTAQMQGYWSSLKILLLIHFPGTWKIVTTWFILCPHPEFTLNHALLYLEHLNEQKIRKKRSRSKHC